MESDEYVMRDYYEVLGVSIDCTESDIRRAYKKAALRCHPDKNIGRIQEAEEEFKEVQEAYGVLVDEKERAWYDAHKEQILRGDKDGNSAPDEVNLYEFVNPRCFSGFNDSERGFFTVYHKLFSTIIDEEQKDWNQQQAGQTKKQQLRPCPKFGSSADSYDDVVGPFYAFWDDYSTRKSFSWKDEYKAHEMPDRFQRRKAEQINQKERANARKEYNQLVQDLVAFVKRRDPRVAQEETRRSSLAAAKAEAKLQKDIEKGKKQREANKKLWEEIAAAEALAEAEEEERYQRMLEAGEIDEAGAPVGVEELLEKQRQVELEQIALEEAEKAALAAESHTCEACGNATFTGSKAWTAHCNSKKHKNNLRSFQRQQKKQIAEPSVTTETKGSQHRETELQDQLPPSKLSKKQKQQRNQAEAREKLRSTLLQNVEDNSDTEEEEEEEEEQRPVFGGFAALGKKKKR